MKFAENKMKSWQKALIYLAVWLLLVIGIKLLADSLMQSILLHIAYVMILLPVITLVTSFIYTRKNGLNFWLIAYIATAAVILYFVFGFNDLNPDFLVVNILSGFFGFGVGDIFKDEAAVAVQQDLDNERKKKKLAEEMKYVSVIDADPNSDKKGNLRKRKAKKRKN